MFLSGTLSPHRQETDRSGLRYIPGGESAGGFSVSVIVPNYRRWRDYDSMTTGEITDQAPDYRPDGVRGGDLTRSYRGQCNTISEAHSSLYLS